MNNNYNSKINNDKSINNNDNDNNNITSLILVLILPYEAYSKTSFM